MDLVGVGRVLGIVDPDDRAAREVERVVQRPGLGSERALGHGDDPQPPRQSGRGKGGAGGLVVVLGHEADVEQLARVAQPCETRDQPLGNRPFVKQRHKDRHDRQARDGGRGLALPGRDHVLGATPQALAQRGSPEAHVDCQHHRRQHGQGSEGGGRGQREPARRRGDRTQQKAAEAPAVPGAAALFGRGAGFGLRHEAAGPCGHQRIEHVALGRNRDHRGLQRVRQLFEPAREFLGAGCRDHRAAAHPAPGNDPMAHAEIGARGVDQPGVRRLGDQVDDLCLPLFGKRAVKLGLADHAVGQQDLAQARLLPALQRQRLDQVARVERAARNQQLPDQRPRRAGGGCHRPRGRVAYPSVEGEVHQTVRHPCSSGFTVRQSWLMMHEGNQAVSGQLSGTAGRAFSAVQPSPRRSAGTGSSCPADPDWPRGGTGPRTPAGHRRGCRSSSRRKGSRAFPRRPPEGSAHRP